MTAPARRSLPMPLMLPKRSGGGSSPRKSRIARVSAKRPARQREEQGEELDPTALPFGSAAGRSAAAGEPDAFVDEAPAESRTRPDSGTYLSMYFRDMAELDVLRPEEEFTSAREIEALEIMLWEATLSYAPAVDAILASVEIAIQQLPNEAKTLRKASESPVQKTWQGIVSR